MTPTPPPFDALHYHENKNAPLSDGPTLMEDWMARRNYLLKRIAQQEVTVPRDLWGSELHVLEYLIKRYDGTEESRSISRFPLRTEAVVYFNHRLLVLSLHFGKKYGTKPKSEKEAAKRVSGILKRFAGRDAQGDLQPQDINSFTDESKKVDPERVDLNMLEKIYARSRKTHWKDQIFERMADNDPDVRVRAIYSISQCGSLDDIGLLSDFLLIPTQSNEDMVERPLLVWTMRQLSLRGEPERESSEDGWAS